jgi:hypothetical protein
MRLGTTQELGRVAAFGTSLLLAACSQGIAFSSNELVAEIPYLSGEWVRNSLTFEDPASGPGPLRNLNRRPDGTSGVALVGDYNNPILRPAAAERVRALGEISLSGNSFPDPENQCWPWQVPNIFRHMQIQVLQEPDQVVILYNRDHQVRRVRLNDVHPTNVVPSWFGDSIGHYEGDTLVIDTVGVKVGHLSMIDWLGTPFSESMRVVERYRLIDYETAKSAVEEHERRNGQIPPNLSYPDLAYMGEGLQMEFTVEDPNTFTTPWSSVVTFRRAGSPWTEFVCAENLREVDGSVRQVPRADTPDF